MEFDALVIGGGAAGMSCALVLGSGLSKPFAKNRKLGIILHQKASHLQSALFNNVLGLPAGTEGKDVLKAGIEQLSNQYPDVVQIHNEKVLEVRILKENYEVVTNKETYTAKKVVVAVGYTDLFAIKGLEKYIRPHKKAKPSKKRIELENKDHLIIPGLYVAGTLAGHRSQFAIASGSGAAVATDILTDWNGGEHIKVHDKVNR